MPILFFDLETTSVVQPALPLTDDRQPHIVQLAMVLCDDDLREVSVLSTVVDPGIEIPEGAARIHGITTEIAREFGVHEKGAAGIFARFLERADLVVAYNKDFDLTVMGIAAERYKVPLRYDGKTVRCAMQAASPICALPPTQRMIDAGFGDKFKSPKLEEAVRILCGRELEGAHDALVDVRGCIDVYRALEARGVWKEAAQPPEGDSTT